MVLAIPKSWMSVICLFVLVGNALLITLGLRRAIIMTMSIKSRNAAAGMLICLLAIIVVSESIMVFASWRVFVHQLPLLPVITRAMVLLVFHRIAWNELSEDAKEREEYRTVVLGLMAITFAGLVALGIVDAKFSVFQIYPFYFMLLSFLSLYLTLTIQSYKDFEWQEQLGAAFLDSATLSLFLSLISIIESGNQLQSYKRAFAALALGAWLIDHAVRLRKEFRVAWTEVLAEREA
jgi:hypothetical protein